MFRQNEVLRTLSQPDAWARLDRPGLGGGRSEPHGVGADGAAKREAWRRFAHGCLMPLLNQVAAERARAGNGRGVQYCGPVELRLPRARHGHEDAHGARPESAA